LPSKNRENGFSKTNLSKKGILIATLDNCVTLIVYVIVEYKGKRTNRHGFYLN